MTEIPNLLIKKKPSKISRFFALVSRPQITAFTYFRSREKGKGFFYKGKEFIHHSDLHLNQTAFHRLSPAQMIFIAFVIVLIEAGLYINWHETLVTIIALLTFLYFADLLFNLFLVCRSFANPSEVRITSRELLAVDSAAWPTYTVFCPLYKEWQILPQFVKAMSALDYPKDKLEVMLLLEEDDKETITQVRKYDLPSFFTVTIVPHSLPKTKPKACNYGLLHAKGEYVVIYDAEDIPDPKQLKKAVLAFKKMGEKVVCIQAKLNFYNPHQNLLTRAFTAEYSLWFDLVLTGLQSINAPIPLGGTSNHFRIKDLQRLRGWDSFNVTEDCDLGIRIAKRGFRTALLDSTTLEEANSGKRNWLWQRSRWIKGYMQTYLVHMRNPFSFIRNRQALHLLTFQLVVGGKVLSMFINPFMWTITVLYFIFRLYIGSFIESFFPGAILYMGIFSLLVGNFLYAYYYMIGCAKHGHHELIKYVFLIPFYWLAMSVAAWIAFYKLIVAPHHWSKTKHGLHLAKKRIRRRKLLRLPSIDFTPAKLTYFDLTTF